MIIAVFSMHVLGQARIAAAPGLLSPANSGAVVSAVRSAASYDSRTDFAGVSANPANATSDKLLITAWHTVLLLNIYVSSELPVHVRDRNSTIEDQAVPAFSSMFCG
jgi:hypothetical protein